MGDASGQYFGATAACTAVGGLVTRLFKVVALYCHHITLSIEYAMVGVLTGKAVGDYSTVAKPC